jgi:alkyl hydroperoxide reductase subunit AhpC
MTARAEQKAPDFKMAAYHQGLFKEIELNDFAGKWLVLFFYPGDFTFV